MSIFSRRFLVRVSTFLVVGYFVVSSAHGADQPPEPRSPSSATGALALIGDDCPRFQWGEVAGTELYELVIYRIGEVTGEAELVFRKSFSGSVSSWTPEGASCLRRGERYAWSVRSVREGQATGWSEPSFFEVIELTGQVHKASTPGGRPEAEEPEPKNAGEDGPSPLSDETALEEAEDAFRARDYATALNLLKPLAEQGNPRAQNGLGMIYGQGLGVERDLRKAVMWHRRAAEQGYARGQYFLGLMYADGAGVPKDPVQAVEWLSRAAEQGDAGAAFSLGAMYAEGEGVEKDSRQAAEWYRRAAELGHPDAQHNLALMLSSGEGITQDQVESLRLEREAAEKGDPLAQFRLGTLYALGRGVPRDHNEAFDWISKATTQGYPLFFHFEPEWTIGHYAERPNGDWIMEFVREKDDINDWTELLTIQKFDIWWGGSTAQEPLDLLKAQRERICPGATEWKVISIGSGSVLYEWQTHSCRGWPDQHEIAKIIYGRDMRIRLAYSVKGEIPPARHAKWTRRFSEAAIETIRR